MHGSALNKLKSNSKDSSAWISSFVIEAYDKSLVAGLVLVGTNHWNGFIYNVESGDFIYIDPKVASETFISNKFEAWWLVFNFKILFINQ